MNLTQTINLLTIECLKSECEHADHKDLILKRLWSKKYPASLAGYSIENTSLICTCGHYINCHSSGLDGGISVCEEEDGFCGCMYPEVDVGENIRELYFYKGNGRIRIDKFNSAQNFEKVWSLTSYGLPMFVEMDALPFKERVAFA